MGEGGEREGRPRIAGDEMSRAVTALGCGGLIAAMLAYAVAAFPQSPRSLKELAPGERVVGIEYCKGRYRIATADGGVRDVAEYDLQFKTDSGALGPAQGTIAIIPAGRVGDRFHIVFAEPAAIGPAIKQACAS